MKQIISIFSVLILSVLVMNGQDGKTPATIFLKNGKTIDVYHFGQVNCNCEAYYASYIKVKGIYEGSFTEIKDYSTISKIVLTGFTELPISSKGNEKGKITIFKKSGISVDLEDAELLMACYGGCEKYNQIKIQRINPITEKVIESTVDTKDIQSVIFK